MNQNNNIFSSGLVNQDGLNFGSDLNQQESILNNYDFGFAAQTNEAIGAQTMKIRKLYLALTRNQKQQHRRSYDVYLDGEGLQKLSNKIDSYGSEAFTQVNIADVMSTSNIIKPSGTAEASVSIENGWEANRYMFTMLVDIYRNGDFKRTEFVSGYTDCDDISGIGMTNVNISPNMIFTINHISEASIRGKDIQGRPLAMISQSHAVLKNADYTSFNNTQNDLYMMRPSDILRSVNHVELRRGLEESNMDMQGATFRDLDSTLTKVPMMANDHFSLTPTFTSRILQSLHTTKLPEHDPMSMDNGGRGQIASTLVADQTFSKNGFVFQLNRITANSVTTTSRFSYGDLLTVDPTIDDRTTVFGRAYETGQISFPSVSNTAVIGAGEQIAVDGTMFAHSVMSLMGVAGISTIGFNANNHSRQHVVTMQAVEGMDSDGMLRNRLEHFKGRLIIECLNIISRDNEKSYNIDVFASAINDIFIQITVDNEYREYVFPAFAGALTLPIVTNTASRLTDVASKVNEIVGMLDTRESDYKSNFGNSIFAAGNGESRVAGLAGDF